MGRNRNKNRGKWFERKVAKFLGGERYPADSGGRSDVFTDELEAQCKYVKDMSHRELTDLAQEMQHHKKGKHGFVVHQIPPGQGKQTPMLITMTAEVFLAWQERRNL